MKVNLAKKISGFEALAILSSLGMTGWITTEFYGGMSYYYFKYTYIALLIIFLYSFSFLETLISLFERNPLKIKLSSHFVVIASIIVINLYHSELFKSEKVTTATMTDDLFHYTLILREDGTFDYRINGIFRTSDIYYGEYSIKEDSLILTKKSHDNYFIQDTMLISKKDSAIYHEKDQNGNFREVKEWLNYFQIQ